MENASVWARRPRYVFHSPTSLDRQTKTNIYYTWTGPIDPKLYSDSLTHLSKCTEQNLAYLEGIKHWLRKNPVQTTDRPTFLSSAQLSWYNSDISTPSSTLNLRSSVKGDDTSSITSYSGPTNHCYLCSTLEEHQKHQIRMCLPMKPKKVVKKKTLYAAPLPRVRPKLIEKPPPDVYDSRYKVVVWTGNEHNASTDANVYITIKGKQNVLHQTKLSHGSTNIKFCFFQGSKETFFIRSPYLGSLEILTIEHDGLKRRQSWYCEKVEVTCLKTRQHWVFVCKNWLSLHHGDYMTSRDLTVAHYTARKLQEFELTVTTGKKQLAGTDAQVSVTFRGAEGISPKIKLTADGSHKPFQRNSVDKFHIRFHNIGEISSLRIEHDGTGLASGWYLDNVVLRSLNDKDTIYYFLLNGWIATDVGDGQLWREIKAKRKLPKVVTSGKPVHYSVTVCTGDVPYAGTDANVHIIIQGMRGKTKKLFLDDARNNFERGMTETFELTAMNTGPITRINIGHDNSGPGAGWFCEDIKVRKYLLQEEISDLLKKLKTRQKMKDRQKRKDKFGKIRRSSSESLRGEKTESEEEDDDDDDERENKVGLDESFRNIFDTEGKVIRVPVYEEYYFICKNWLATDESDGLLERELEVKKKETYFQDL